MNPRISRRRLPGWGSLLLVLLTLGSATDAEAAFPGRNGDLAVAGFNGTINLIAPNGKSGLRAGVRGGDPAFSASGRTLLFRAGDPFNGRRVGIAGWRLSPRHDAFWLTSPSRAHREQQPAPAPGGRRFAYTHESRESGYVPHIFIARLPSDGDYPPPRPLGVAGACPAWSPDGDAIAYVAGDGREIALVGPDGRPLGSVFRERNAEESLGCPSWSPSGRRLAFASTRRQRILVVGRSGELKRSFRHPWPQDAVIEPIAVAFSPNGRLIAFAHELTWLYTVRVRDGMRRRVCRCEVQDLDWRPRR